MPKIATKSGEQKTAEAEVEGFREELGPFVVMNLGGDKSFPVADALAARGVPFIFSTGYTGRDMREGYRDRPVLKKPFRSEDLTGVLSRLLAR